MPIVEIAGKKVGDGHPVMVCAEMGINHLGEMSRALRLIQGAWQSGADIIKFQKRTPRLCVPESEWAKPKETPWGTMPYIEYRERTEFGKAEYDQIDAYCKKGSIPWFASVWDEEALTFIEQYNPPAYKVGSPSLTDAKLLSLLMQTQKPLVVSTGMSSWQEIEASMALLAPAHDRLVLCHCTSIYPTPYAKMNLRMIESLRKRWPQVVIGYSGHERGTDVTIAAVALGAAFIERHFTDDRFGWGTDQPASIEHWQFSKMADAIHRTSVALGTGKKVVYPEEVEAQRKLRRVISS